MNKETFDKLVNERIRKNLETLGVKGEGYARGGDRLIQFKEVAMRNHETPEKSLHGMAEKHNVTIQFAIQDINNGDTDFITQKWIDDKIGDAINYLLMLEGLLVERLLTKKADDEAARIRRMEANDE